MASHTLASCFPVGMPPVFPLDDGSEYAVRHEQDDEGENDPVIQNVMAIVASVLPV